MIFGIVNDGVFYGERAEIRLSTIVNNGICSMEPERAVPFREVTPTPANLTDAIAAFRKFSTFDVIRGISFHNGIVPVQPVKYPNLPIAVVDGRFDEFELIEVVAVRGKFLYYLQTIHDAGDYILGDLRDSLAKSPAAGAKASKGATPAMRVVASFHQIEARRKLEAEPLHVITSSMSQSGAKVVSIVKRHNGYEVTWTMKGHSINTLLSADYRVMEAGFCTSGGDRSQSARSLPNLLDTYVQDGSYIHKTRT
jgi:hypothetical protein